MACSFPRQTQYGFLVGELKTLKHFIGPAQEGTVVAGRPRPPLMCLDGKNSIPHSICILVDFDQASWCTTHQQARTNTGVRYVSNQISLNQLFDDNVPTMRPDLLSIFK